ncbi:MAG: threonylcarbamoyl-AMP synthase [Alphaproteobacteria bacterium RIFCSPLOWO2_01_FULL_40_26]|nr:MAG: threonylcarbamoyl-AMP synthase [Alphaproteobacteria bacterium RIFCSPHIGHO2_02_FULL_40_34]OFW85527.1 MAG: threonylcarbamoyl-AMP synthase [Alphaproteobacteria bacterium RIFCSPHIGHO2_01_FULL_40_8]OFW94672.1 MAG: threonylcarbamoyl-AMP synthase [Alphaproteobacteria bacterium RIFCSPLOWO2_01_FULL_40_26]OFX10140.1 MAG: threonylcarbamoyl-AMP synthase [Alphaproteobacteria bacterium RIFCSPLOWO2_02_FULL_40_19]OFX11769.1 MAG: threonylcarbamoyl-AMP synthase [Alphaproteobacteria bacterium RIFCSPLOWO2_
MNKNECQHALIINQKAPNAVNLACKFLREGKVISFPSDTIYGIAVDASNSKAVRALYRIKNRDEKKPIAIFVKDLKAAEKIFCFDKLSKKIVRKFFPGQLTLVLKTKPEASSFLASNLNKNNDGFLGFRIIDSFFVQKLFEKFDGNLAVTSANISDQKAATSAKEVAKYFEKLDLVIDGGICDGQPSTVAKITDDKIEILRQGKIKVKIKGKIKLVVIKNIVSLKIDPETSSG